MGVEGNNAYATETRKGEAAQEPIPATAQDGGTGTLKPPIILLMHFLFSSFLHISPPPCLVFFPLLVSSVIVLHRGNAKDSDADLRQGGQLELC